MRVVTVCNCTHVFMCVYVVLLYACVSLTCVCLHMLIEILLHVEVFATPLAHELLVSNVDAHVRPQLILILETLITILCIHTEIDSVGESSSCS